MTWIYDRYRALDLALRIWNIYEMPDSPDWDPFDAIDFRTAWAVGKIVHCGSRRMPYAITQNS